MFYADIMQTKRTLHPKRYFNTVKKKAMINIYTKVVLPVLRWPHVRIATGGRVGHRHAASPSPVDSSNTHANQRNKACQQQYSKTETP